VTGKVVLKYDVDQQRKEQKTSQAKGIDRNVNHGKQIIQRFLILCLLAVLRIKPRASPMLGKHSTTNLYPNPNFCFQKIILDREVKIT
jgi:hypothetical protein